MLFSILSVSWMLLGTGQSFSTQDTLSKLISPQLLPYQTLFVAMVAHFTPGSRLGST